MPTKAAKEPGLAKRKQETSKLSKPAPFPPQRRRCHRGIWKKFAANPVSGTGTWASLSPTTRGVQLGPSFPFL